MTNVYSYFEKKNSVCVVCLCMFVCIHACMFIHVCVCACVFVSTCARMHVCLPLHVCMCLYVHECLFVCVCLHVHVCMCVYQYLPTTLFAVVSSRLAATCPSGNSLLSSSRVVETVGLQMCVTMSGLTWLLGIQSDPHACPVKFQVPIELPAQPVLSTPTVTLLSFSEALERQNQLSSSS